MKKSHEQGMALFLPVLLLGAISLSVFLVLAASLVGSLTDIKNHHDSSLARSYLFGCFDEYLVHLPSDPEFAPTAMSIFPSECQTTISTPIEGQRQIIISTTVGQITRQLTAVVQLTPLTIIRISEP